MTYTYFNRHCKVMFSGWAFGSWSARSGMSGLRTPPKTLFFNFSFTYFSAADQHTFGVWNGTGIQLPIRFLSPFILNIFLF